MRREAVWAAVSVLTAVTLHAQPTIDHVGLDCMRPGEYVVVLSGIDPEDDVQTAKVYFRSRLYSDFYYVEMRYQDGEFIGILPQPSPETPGVVYYLEALDSSFNTARSLEYVADVEGRCNQTPAAAYFPGGGAGITVGATAIGGPALPPGFAAAGIVGTISAAGVASGVGGGIGAGTAVAIGAAAAAGAGAGVAVLTSNGGESTSTSSVVAAVTSTSGGTTTIGAGPTTTTAPGPGTTTTTAGGTTTTVPGGSTTSSANTTTTAGTTSIPQQSLDASCFTVDVLGACRVRVDASCVELPIDQYEWTLDLNNRWKKTEFPNGPATLTHEWPQEECGTDESIRFKLKVRRDQAADTAEKNFFVPGNALKVSRQGPVRVDLVSNLVSPGSTRGRILVNDAPVVVIDDKTPMRVKLSANRGTNTLVAVVVEGSDEPGTWRFALDPVVPESLRIVSGSVLSREPGAVVFRVSGYAGERIELTFVPRE